MYESAGCNPVGACAVAASLLNQQRSLGHVAMQPGVPLELRVTVLDKDCRPLNGTFVDIWSCNSTGVYSGWVLVTSVAGICHSCPQAKSILLSSCTNSEGCQQA